MVKTADHIAELKEKVRRIFDAYLIEKKQRRTSERHVILDEIYSNKEHFDADSLYLKMKKRNYHVSRATVYNTLELLVESGLVKKHQFGSNLSVYEQAFGYKQHDHLICTLCNNIFEFCDPRLQQISNTMGELLKFSVQSHSLHLYGDPQMSGGKCVRCDKNIDK